MNRDVETRELLAQSVTNPRGRACRMGVQRDDHDPVAGDMVTITAQNVP
ncbi:hypothetical protein roselon_01098 [Roseibacterium elongatum DSM 19469]|uniref:Uncharacterized protein n=1 Tax=Roseicyclus elongatus DSM 19469 TaxID=1294273 RepID=W8SLU3_9RHOB|nr:hypothetical protein roselon_01098 [Roseibacterium elongatum DSM 19469]